MTSEIATRDAVRRIVASGPEATGLLQSACHLARLAEENPAGMFAGSWVLQDWARRTQSAKWKPGGLRFLASEGLLVKVDSSRGGRRAYYRMPDRMGVEAALRELGVPELPPS